MHLRNSVFIVWLTGYSQVFLAGQELYMEWLEKAMLQRYFSELIVWAVSHRFFFILSSFKKVLYKNITYISIAFEILFDIFSIIYILVKYDQKLTLLIVPYIAVCSISLFIALGYMTLSDSSSKVFGWLQDLVSVSALIGWMVICIVYLRFYYGCKKQGIDRSELPWKSALQPYAAWLSLISFVVLLLTGGYVTFIHGE